MIKRSIWKSITYTGYLLPFYWAQYDRLPNLQRYALTISRRKAKPSNQYMSIYSF